MVAKNLAYRRAEGATARKRGHLKGSVRLQAHGIRG